MKKIIFTLVMAASLVFVACINQAASNQPVSEAFTNARTVTKVSIETSRQLRLRAAEKAKETKPQNLQEQIKQRLYEAWGSWQPDYEGWLNWSDDLYLPDATIMAIGDIPQKFHDYQTSMKQQRDTCIMEMGPIMQMTVEGNVASLVYEMYLTPKGMENAPTFRMMITEFNTFEIVEGKLMVKRLDLYTDGGGMTQ